MKTAIPILIIMLASCNNTEGAYKGYLTYVAYGAALVTLLAVFKPENQSNTVSSTRLKALPKWGLAIAAFILAALQTHFQTRIDQLTKIDDKQKDSILNARNDTILALTQKNGRLALEQLDTSKLILKYSEELNTTYAENKLLQEQIRKNGLEQLDTSKNILKYSQKLNELYRINAQLQGNLNSYVTGDTLIPIISTSKYRADISWFLVNIGSSPLRNVTIKYKYSDAPEETLIPEIAFLPPGLRVNLTKFYSGNHHQLTYGISFFVRYNNGKYIEVRFKPTTADPQIFWENLGAKYYNRNGEEIKLNLTLGDSLRIAGARDF